MADWVGAWRRVSGRGLARLPLPARRPALRAWHGCAWFLGLPPVRRAGRVLGRSLLPGGAGFAALVVALFHWWLS